MLASSSKRESENTYLKFLKFFWAFFEVLDVDAEHFEGPEKTTELLAGNVRVTEDFRV